jgi:hypothetical protein
MNFVTQGCLKVCEWLNGAKVFLWIDLCYS